MVTIKEIIRGNESSYIVQIKEDKKIITQHEIQIHTARVEKQSNVYYLLYDINMTPVEEAFNFVNYVLDKKSLNTRIKAVEALKILFAYEHIINKRITEFDSVDVSMLINFLSGISFNGNAFSYELIRKRANKTVNEYLSVYRNYLESLGITDHHLLSTSRRNLSFGYGDFDIAVKKDSYKTNLPTGGVIEEVPKYISVEEFTTILSYVRKTNNLKAECIIRLMYENGLRIGEVLGLTFPDDMVEEKYVDIETGEIKYGNFIYIRNRITDSRGQHAKGLIHIRNQKQYKSKDYATRKVGYHRVRISANLYDTINDYIEDAHIYARENKKESYYKNCKADIVTPNSYEKENYYVFINSLGKPLTQQTWNKELKAIFQNCSIHIDYGTKENNLNHRFRHGFAMYNARVRKLGEVELQELLRHKQLSSVMKYYNPSISDRIKIKTDFTEDLYKDIPALERRKDGNQ